MGRGAISSAPTSTSLRRSCVFCRSRKIRCSGGHICTACRERNISCVYGPEARKGRPRRKDVEDCRQRSISIDPRDDVQQYPSKSVPDPTSSAPALGTNRTLGEDLNQMFDEHFISRADSRSNLFQSSIASFQRRIEISPGTSAQLVSYDGLLSWMAYEPVEILLRRVSNLGCQPLDSAGRNLYTTSLAADTTYTMFDAASQNQNPLSAFGKYRVMQLIDVWFSMHPLSPIVSKTLLLDEVKHGIADEALLAVILGDACHFHRSMNGTSSEQDPEVLLQFAATQLSHRQRSLTNPDTLSTAQAMFLLGWRGMCLGHMRRATCLVGYSCRIVARMHGAWGKKEHINHMELNGINIHTVKKELLQNIYWICLSSTTWAFMQIDQPFSLLVPEDLPDFPCSHDGASAILALDRASDNISTLHAQIKSMRWLWPLSHITSTVAHVYTLYLNASNEEKKVKAAPSQTQHIHQLHHLLQSQSDISMLSSQIRNILLQVIQVVQKEVMNPSTSFVLIAYHTIAVHMLFRQSKADQGQESTEITTSLLKSLFESVSSILVLSRSLTAHPNITDPTQKSDKPEDESIIALALDTCSRALVHIYRRSKQASPSENEIILTAQHELTNYADQLHQVCQETRSPKTASALRTVKKRIKRVKTALQFCGFSPNTESLLPSLPDTSHLPTPPDADLSRLNELLLDPAFATDYPSAPAPFNASTDLPMETFNLSELEVFDPCFFTEDPSMGSLLGFPGLVNNSLWGLQDADLDLGLAG